MINDKINNFDDIHVRHIAWTLKNVCILVTFLKEEGFTYDAIYRAFYTILTGEYSSGEGQQSGFKEAAIWCLDLLFGAVLVRTYSLDNIESTQEKATQFFNKFRNSIVFNSGILN